MAKVNPIDGKIRGKLGGRVYALRNGETIIRELNPAPFNPNTRAQVEARAKLKLLSQLASVCAPVIAIPRLGNKSPRNLFTRVNYNLLNYSEETASLPIDNVQLTDSTVGLPAVSITLSGGDLNIALSSAAGAGVDQVLYALFLKGEDNKLRYIHSKLVTVPGAGETFPTAYYAGSSTGPFVVLAYGIRFNNDSARAKFGNMQASQAESLVKLIVSRVLLPSDITLTETKGATYVQS